MTAPARDLHHAVAEVMRAEQRNPTVDEHTPPTALVALGAEALEAAGYEHTSAGWWRVPCPASPHCGGGACSWCSGGVWARPVVVARARRVRRAGR